ncbi:MAG: hypothetical protein J7518_16860 [Nocardioidaceae bacterium]|nr:hypothetical protein [Nocardioidaceae bacterium]
MSRHPRRVAALVAATAGLALAAGLASPALSAAGPTADHGHAGSPGPDARGVTPAADHLRGRSAASVAAIAREHGVAPKVIAGLAHDGSAWFDRGGRAFFVEQTAPGGDPAAAGGASAATPAPYPYAQTFTLHSRPASNRTLYLDFDGAAVSGTAWNTSYNQASVTAEPYDADGNPAAFGSAEQDVIQSVWQRVAEDYASMDVDVTTEAPAADRIDRTDTTDQTYGTAVVISPTSFISSSCACGGMAYLGVFDWAPGHGSYQPAWVFTQGVGTGAKNIAEAVSHEVGHNLGLSHDGTGTDAYYWGQGHWAPIMGAGYNQPLTQFSTGDYAGASNTQDDYAVMGTHGAAQVADDYGDTNATAAALTIGQARSGLVSSRSDVDVFSYSGDAPVSFAIKPASVSPNLDLTVKVTSGGTTTTYAPANVRGDNDVLSGLGATFTVPADNDPATPVYVAVEGTGEGDPLTTGESDYGSRGAYTITTNQQKVGVSAFGWGANNVRQLGDGVDTASTRTKPVPVVAISAFNQIRPGAQATIALKLDGTVWAWGSNSNGMVNPSTTNYYTSPQQVALSGIKSVYAFSSIRFAVDAAGRVYGWGDNRYGQTGVGSTATEVRTPTLIPGLSGVVALAGNSLGVYALKSDGTVWSWGSGAAGRLGNNTNINSSPSPVQASISGVTAIAAGDQNGYALKADGTVWAWGANTNGQDGIGTAGVASYRMVPVQVVGLSGVVSLSNALVVKSDGTVWLWGTTGAGERGDGTVSATGVGTPTKVPGLAGIDRVFATTSGDRTLYAVTHTGDVWSWGENGYFQAANGTAVDVTSPHRIPELSGTSEVSADLQDVFAIQP